MNERSAQWWQRVGVWFARDAPHVRSWPPAFSPAPWAATGEELRAIEAAKDELHRSKIDSALKVLLPAPTPPPRPVPSEPRVAEFVLPKRKAGGPPKTKPGPRRKHATSLGRKDGLLLSLRVGMINRRQFEARWLRLNGLTYRQIAIALGISQYAAKRLISGRGQIDPAQDAEKRAALRRSKRDASAVTHPAYSPAVHVGWDETGHRVADIHDWTEYGNNFLDIACDAWEEGLLTA